MKLNGQIYLCIISVPKYCLCKINKKYLYNITCIYKICLYFVSLCIIHMFLLNDTKNSFIYISKLTYIIWEYNACYKKHLSCLNTVMGLNSNTEDYWKCFIIRSISSGFHVFNSGICAYRRKYVGRKTGCGDCEIAYSMLIKVSIHYIYIYTCLRSIPMNGYQRMTFEPTI